MPISPSERAHANVKFEKEAGGSRWCAWMGIAGGDRKVVHDLTREQADTLSEMFNQVAENTERNVQKRIRKAIGLDA